MNAWFGYIGTAPSEEMNRRMTVQSLGNCHSGTKNVYHLYMLGRTVIKKYIYTHLIA